MECKQCGICCKLFLINLSEEEYKSKTYKTQFDEYTDDFEEAELCGMNILAQNEDGSCIYLKDGKCSIHERRPQVCRNFFCESGEPKSMVEKIKAYKEAQKQKTNG